MKPLSASDRIRFSRHLSLPGFEESHQQALGSASVVVIGAGGLGSPVLLYLAAAGFGRIGIVDDDRVDLSNLQRQVIHSEGDVGQFKAESAANQVRSIRSACEVEIHRTRLTSRNAMELISNFSLVIDGSDNLPTRYLVNDACILSGRPLIYGSVFRFEGQVSVFGYNGGPCYRCLFPAPPPPELVPSCATAGVLGVIPGLVGLYQATEAVKVATGLGETLSGKLLMIDSFAVQHRKLDIPRDPACPVCGTNRTVTELIDYDDFCGHRFVPTISPEQLKTLVSDSEESVVLVDVREEDERAAGNIGGLHIPLPQMAQRLAELTNAGSQQVVFYCRTGIRSATAAQMLLELGLNALSLEGGLALWKARIDPTITVL